MIQRELQTVQVITYSTTKNAMGQTMTTQSSTRDVAMVIKPYSNSVVDNPRFNDCEFVGITKDRDIQVGQSIKIGDVVYDIEYIIPSFRYNQLLLRKFK